MEWNSFDFILLIIEFLASFEIVTLSVLIYVISPASYSFWAVLIVLETPNPSFLDASCWRVEVVKGGVGDLFDGFLDKDSI